MGGFEQLGYLGDSRHMLVGHPFGRLLGQGKNTIPWKINLDVRSTCQDV